jgi:DHA2 family methylenomycin A resistance protein-like MFS transporter
MPSPRNTANTATTANAALAASVLGFFVITLDAFVVNVALPDIHRDLGGGITGLQWVIDGYTLMFAALMMPSSLTLIREAFPDQVRRGKAIALWTIGASVAAAAGPVVGGALSLVDWRSIFFANLPVGAVALVLLARAHRSARRDTPLDLVGQIAAVAALAGLTYGVIQAGADGFTSPGALAALAIAVVGAIVFIAAQAHGSHPMAPLDLLRTRTMVVSAGTGFAFIAWLSGTLAS